MPHVSRIALLLMRINTIYTIENYYQPLMILPD
ncbi:hypothetical protein SAMN05877962_11971 [Alloalcanivorax xenomutans]|nr:hypothetical protein Q668_07830 [Alcanivorax sp. PN-3]SOC22685.1 hypothetical protein SAMN05877962_11971 [Alloalcanivorax xenomutans]